MLVAVEGKGHLLERVLALGGSWLTQLRVRPGRAPHAGHSPWLRRHRRFWGRGGLSRGGGDGRRPGPGSRGASRPARPAGNDSEAAALGVGEVEAGS